MRRIINVGAVVFTVIAAASVNIAQQARTATPAGPSTTAVAAKTAVARPQPSGMPVEDQTALVKQYCMGCHNDNVKSGGISLSKLDLVHPDQSAELAERVIRQVKAGQMPKVGSPRPAAEVLKKFAGTLSDEMDRSAAQKIDPGSRPFQRLTRTEYAKSVQDLLGIEEDVSALLP